MAQPAQPFQQRDFSRGVYSDLSTAIAPPNSVQHSVNFVYYESYGNAKVRSGSTIIGSQLVAEDNSVLGLFDYRDRAGGNDTLIASCNVAGDATQSIFNASSGAAVQTGDTANLVPRFETFLGEVVRQNGGDAAESWEGTGTFDATGGSVDIANMPVGIDVLNFKDRLWVLTVDGTLEGSSIPASPTFNSISWTSGNKNLPVDPDQSSYAGNAVGLAKLSGLMLIFKERALYTYNGSATQTDFLYNVGCSSVRSIGTGAGLCFFFNPDGIWITNGGQPQRISRPVQQYIDGMSSANFSSVAGIANGKHYWCSIGDVTIGLTTYSNVVLRYTIATQEWAVLSYATRPTVFAQYINGTDVEIVYGDDTARVLRLDVGTTDNGTAIPFELITHPLEFGSRALKKDVHRKIFLFSENNTGVEVQMRTDKGDFETVGSANTDSAEIHINDHIQGNSHELRIVGTSVGTPMVFEGYEIPNVNYIGYGTE